MANPGLSFKKVASKPTSGMTVGEIYFVTGDKTIYVATSATTLAPFYGGEVKNVEYFAKSGETEKTQLKFTMMDGTSWTMDFSDCASATEVTNALNSLNIAYNSTTGTATQPVYDSRKTTYLNGNVSFGTTTGASYVTVTETSDANLKLIRAASGGNTVTVDGINTPADSADGDTYPNYAANKGYVDNIKCEYNSTDKKIYLKNYTDSNTPKLLSTIDCDDFIKDGILDGTALITATATSQKVTINKIEYTVTGLIVGRTYIVFAWNASAGKSVQALDVTSLIDVYTAGNNGISVDGYKINLKLQNASSATDKNILEIASDGLKINTFDTFDTVTDGHFIRENSESAPNTWTLKIDTDSEKNRINSVVTNSNLKNIVGNSATAKTDVTATTSNPYINFINNDTVKSSVQLKAGGSTSVTSSADGKTITISSTDTNTHYKSINFVGNSATSAANASNVTNGNVYLNHFENTGIGDTPSYSIQSSHNIKGTNAIEVTANNGVISVNSTWAAWS